MHKSYIRFSIILFAVFFIIQGCEIELDKSRSADAFVKFLKKQRMPIQNVFDYSESKKTEKLVELMEGRVLEITTEGISVMVVEKKNNQQAKELAQMVDRELILSIDSVTLVPHINNNLVLLVEERDLRSRVAQRMIMKFKSFR